MGFCLDLGSSERRKWASLHHSREAFRVSHPLHTPQMQTMQWWLLGCITGGMVSKQAGEALALSCSPAFLQPLPSAYSGFWSAVMLSPHPETVSHLLLPFSSSSFCSPFRCHCRPETERASSLLHNSPHHTEMRLRVSQWHPDSGHKTPNHCGILTASSARHRAEAPNEWIR